MSSRRLVKETNKYELWEETYSNKVYTSNLTKYLCIGGPLDGEFKSTASAKDYLGYNAADGGSRHRHILLHRSILSANN